MKAIHRIQYDPKLSIKGIRRGLKKGADINEENSIGRTLLIDAAIHQNSRLVGLALSFNADVNCVDDDGEGEPNCNNSACHYACINGDFESMRLLLACPDLQLELQNEFGQTPLHCLLKYSQHQAIPRDIFRFFMSDKYEHLLSIKDIYDKIPLDYNPKWQAFYEYKQTRAILNELENQATRQVFTQGVGFFSSANYDSNVKNIILDYLDPQENNQIDEEKNGRDFEVRPIR